MGRFADEIMPDIQRFEVVDVCGRVKFLDGNAGIDAERVQHDNLGGRDPNLEGVNELVLVIVAGVGRQTDEKEGVLRKPSHITGTGVMLEVRFLDLCANSERFGHLIQVGVRILKIIGLRCDCKTGVLENGDGFEIGRQSRERFVLHPEFGQRIKYETGPFSASVTQLIEDTPADIGLSRLGRSEHEFVEDGDADEDASFP